MAKGSGSTRASSSGNPNGLRGGVLNLNNPKVVSNEISDTENTIGELRAMQDDLYSRIADEEAYLEIEPENEVAIQDRIDELSKEANQIDSEINNLRDYIDWLREKLK